MPAYLGRIRPITRSQPGGSIYAGLAIYDTMHYVLRMEEIIGQHTQPPLDKISKAWSATTS